MQHMKKTIKNTNMTPAALRQIAGNGGARRPLKVDGGAYDLSSAARTAQGSSLAFLRSTAINPISVSAKHYFHQSIFYLSKYHSYKYNALTRIILCMNPVSISVKEDSFLST